MTRAPKSMKIRRSIETTTHRIDDSIPVDSAPSSRVGVAARNDGVRPTTQDADSGVPLEVIENFENHPVVSDYESAGHRRGNGIDGRAPPAPGGHSGALPTE